MKKLWTERRWKQYQSKRQHYEAARRRERRAWIRRRRRANQWKPNPRRRPRKNVTVTAPARFSMVENPEEMSRFLKRLSRENDRRHHVFVDLSGISTLTSDGIAVLLARVKRGRSGVTTGGNWPNDPKLKSMLTQSGFAQHVVAPGVDTSGDHGEIVKRSSYKVMPDMAQSLIACVTRGLTGRKQRRQPVQSALLECMSNTHDHAAPASEREGWWATAYYDENERKAFFTFVDLGVGIFRSRRVTLLQTVLKHLGAMRNVVLMEDILKGNVPSRTGFPFRGKGLPWIYKLSQMGHLRNLIVVSNDVFADVARDKYRSLDPPFGGTLLYWEIGD